MRSHRAFSLTELLVVIAVIAILASLLLTVTGQVWSSAQAVVCQHQLEQIGKACQLYANRNGGYEIRATALGGTDDTRWYAQVLPYLGGARASAGLAVLRCPLSRDGEGETVTAALPPGAPPRLAPHPTEAILAISYSGVKDPLWDVGFAWSHGDFLRDILYDDSRANRETGYIRGPDYATKGGSENLNHIRICYDRCGNPTEAYYNANFSPNPIRINVDWGDPAACWRNTSSWVKVWDDSQLYSSGLLRVEHQSSTSGTPRMYYEFKFETADNLEKPHQWRRNPLYTGTDNTWTAWMSCHDYKWPMRRWKSEDHEMPLVMVSRGDMGKEGMPSFTPETLGNYGQVWLFVRWGFDFNPTTRPQEVEIETLKRFREEAGGSLFINTCLYSNAGRDTQAVMDGLGFGLVLEPRVFPAPPHEYQWYLNPPDVRDEAIYRYYPEVEVADAAYASFLDSCGNVNIPHYYAVVAKYNHTAPRLFNGSGGGYPLAYHVVPKLNPQGNPENPYAKVAVAYKSNSYGGAGSAVAVVDDPQGGGKVAVYGVGAHAFFASYGAYAMGGETWHHHRPRTDCLEMARNIALWLKGGQPAPPPAPTPSDERDTVGSCTYGYNNRVGVKPLDPNKTYDPENPDDAAELADAMAQTVNASVVNPSQTIRALDYADFVAAKEDGTGQIAARHDGKANVLFMDGRVELLTPEEIMNPERNYWDLRK